MSPGTETVSPGFGLMSRIARGLRKHPAVWVAIVLWIASNLFVSVIGRIATWEQHAKYYGPADLCRLDCGWYSTIITDGYGKLPRPDGTSNWPFHPLLPLSAYPLVQWLGLPLGVGLVLASKLALLLAIYGFLLLLGQDTTTLADRVMAGSLVAFNPYVIYAHAGYAEPLYFAMLTFAFYFASRKEWIASGIAGALTSASRVIGFVFAVPYFVAWMNDCGWRPRWRDSKQLLGLLLCPLGTLLFMLYLYHHMGDALAQVHGNIAWNKSPGNPFAVLWHALQAHHWPRVWAVMAIASFAGSAYLFKLRKPELAIYLLISMLLSISGGYSALARYVWWQPPFICAIYYFLKRHSSWLPIYSAFSAGMASFLIIEWFSGHSFIV